MEQTQGVQKKRMGLLGEWSWEKYLVLFAGIACLLDALVEQGLAIRSIPRDGAFHSALLFFALFYLSELRYKLFPEVRNN